MKIRWSPKAIYRLEEIGDYIAEEYPQTALRILREIIESIARLEQFPKSGRVVPEFNNPEIREVIHSPYRILYQEYENVVEIISVLHSRQLLTKENLEN